MVRSLKQQLLALIIAPILVLSLSLTLILGYQMIGRVKHAAEAKARSDLATGEAIIDLMYPGPWEEKDGVLYKGGVKINNNFVPVDRIAELTGDTVTIFLYDTRVSTTVRQNNGERAVGTKVSSIVAETVLKNGNLYLGPANVVGTYYEMTAYKPIRDSKGRIIGMFYVGISKEITSELSSLVTIAVVGITLTILVALVALYFTHRLLRPINEIIEGSFELAEGHPYHKVEVTSQNEIGRLAEAFNQLVEGVQRLAEQIEQVKSENRRPVEEVHSNNGFLQPVAAVIPPEQSKSSYAHLFKEEELPKGLQESTLKQILAYLEENPGPASSEEIGEGLNITRVTAKRYLDFLEKVGLVEVEMKYGTVGRPVKLYKLKKA